MLTLSHVLLLFALFAVIGWGFEVFVRFFVNTPKRLVNPGFLSGPYLPIYGFGMLILVFISSLEISIVPKVILFTLTITSFELVTGLFFTDYYNIKLWDYSEYWLNYRGIISPLASSLWAVLSVVFYYFFYPNIMKITAFFMHLSDFYFFLGLFYGLIIFDTLNSFNVAFKIKEFVSEFNRAHLTRLRVNFKALKADAKKDANKESLFDRIFFSSDFHLQNRLFEQLRNNLARIRRRDKEKEEKETVKKKKIKIIPISQLNRHNSQKK